MVRARIGSLSGGPDSIGAGADDPFALCLTFVAHIGQNGVALGCLIALGGCGNAPVIDVEGVVRDGHTGHPIAHAQITTDDGRSVETDDDGHFAVAVAEGSSVIAHSVGKCEARETARRGASVVLNLMPRLELEEENAQVGFDHEVRIEVRARCDESAELVWRQIAGPELGDRMHTEDRGRVLVVRTHPIEELARIDDRIGVLALDRHARGDYRFEVSVGDGEDAERRTVRVLAAPTSAGLFQVPTGADMYLNGGPGGEHAWTILARPEGSQAELEGEGLRIARLRPDRFGTYLIEHRPSLVQLSIQAGAYEDVPRDCGREGCHSREAEGWEETAHARTFRRGLDGELGDEFEERCWSCHATGVDVGVENGGLHQTAEAMGWTQPEPDAGVFDRAPRVIRRHGSVWCSACHGPGRIVPPQFRWQYGAKFQSGVCARCHDVDEGDPDANHISPEVDEWRLAAMSALVRGASATDEPALRSGCAECHSAQGFVAWQRGTAVVPDPGTVEPIACTACHDAHDASRPFALRVFDNVDAIGGAPAEHLGEGALCSTCHRTGIVVDAPHAPHADMLLGRGARLAPALDGGVHRFIADTCVRCHMTRPAEGNPFRGRAGGHTFSVRARVGENALSTTACAPCHGDVAPDDVGMRDWDGDGTSGRIDEEQLAMLTSIGERLHTRIGALHLHDTCEPTNNVAADVIEHDAQLYLSSALNLAIGDCDRDGRVDEGETWMLASRLPRPLFDAAYDTVFLRADGSGGRHNPEYSFRVGRAILDALE